MSANKEKTQTKKQKTTSLLFIFVVNALITCVLVVSLLYGYHTYKAPHIIVFDLKQFADNLRSEAVSGKINQDEMMVRYKEMETWVKQQPKNYIVLMQELVLANGEKGRF